MYRLARRWQSKALPWRHLGAAVVLAALVGFGVAVPDATFERAGGLDRALAAQPPTMTADPGVEGRTIQVRNACGIEGCTASFEFAIAKEGTYPYRAAGGRLVKGIYVRINASYDADACDLDCKELNTLQVFRYVTTQPDGTTVTAAPVSPDRRRKAGWDNPNAPSRGWFVDTGNNGVFYGPGYVTGSSETGSRTSPMVVRDAPGLWDGTTNQGAELTMCAVCDTRTTSVGALRAWEAEQTRHERAVRELQGIEDAEQRQQQLEAEETQHRERVIEILGQQKVLACVTYGFMIGQDGSIDFSPKPPTGHATPPQHVQDAVRRFEGLPGTEPGNIQF